MSRVRNVILEDLASYSRSSRYRRYSPPADHYMTRIASCVGIAAAFAALIWVYGWAFHRDEIWVPTLGGPVAAVQQTSGASDLATKLAPAPDMHSAAIQYANADVIQQSNDERGVGDPATPAQHHGEHVTRSKPKHQKIRRSLSEAAANSYAAAKPYYGSAAKSHYGRPEIGAE